MLVSVLRLLQSLLAQFVSSQMIRFRVSGGSGCVRVFSKVVQFCGSIVRTLRHGVLLTCSMQTSREWVTGMILQSLGQFSNWCRGALKGHGRGTLWVAVPKMPRF